MPAPWSTIQLQIAKKQLYLLYIKENKTIKEISKLLQVGETTVYERIKRTGLQINRQLKTHYNNRNCRVMLPKNYSAELAEFTGILLGDGHLTPTQVTVTLGKKEKAYVDHVAQLMKKLFEDLPRKYMSKRGDWTVYVGSTELVRWFLKNGLVFNKVKSQVRVPKWCFRNDGLKRRLLRGLIDTDGSVYKLKSGTQISFCNCSARLLYDTRKILLELGFNPSRISANKIYLTRKKDLWKYYEEIGFGNSKHANRFLEFTEA